MFGVGLNFAETIRPSSARRLPKTRPRLNAEHRGSNYTTAQEVALFRHLDALRFDPSVVVLGIYTNDFKGRSAEPRSSR
jgi:hypothetical protein